MGHVIQAQEIFLKSKQEHVDSMKREERLRELASTAVAFYKEGLTGLSNGIILGVIHDEKTEFRVYMEEYLKNE